MIIPFRDKIIDEKFPLHLAMTGYSDDDVSAEFQIKLIKKLLAEYPAAAFQEVVEEVRHLRLSGLQTTSPASVDDGGFRQFQIQIQVKRWTPVERAQKSSDEKVRSERSKISFPFSSCLYVLL